MRDNSGDRSLIRPVLFFSVLFLGLLLRLLGLEEVSAWGDEVASHYFSHHLANVFFTESHTPLYYALAGLWQVFFPDSVLSLRWLSVFSNLALTLLCTWLLWRKRGWDLALLFLTVWWLWPTNIIFARQARHYGLYADLAILILVLWDQRDMVKKWALWVAFFLFQFLYPLALIPSAMLILFDYFKTKDLKKTVFYLTASLPVMTYYGVRFLLFGGEQVMSNIAWVSNDFNEFVRAVVLLFGGASFPFTHVYPLPPEGVLGLLLLTVPLFFFQKDRSVRETSWRRSLVLLILTVLLVELLGAIGVNLRINRYFMYFLAFFFWPLLELGAKGSAKSLAFLILLFTYNALVFKPWRDYVWDDDNVAAFKELLSVLPERPLVVCGNAPQQHYYFNLPYSNCSKEALRLYHEGAPFYFFDMNGNDRHTAVYLLDEAEDAKKFNQALFLSVSPKKDKE